MRTCQGAVKNGIGRITQSDKCSANSLNTHTTLLRQYTIGIAPGANINPPREYPSMFEPVHGSAPDIAGQGIANPIGQIWSGAMMLDHLGHDDAAAAVVGAIERVLADGACRTPDLGGTADTAE